MNIIPNDKTPYFDVLPNEIIAHIARHCPKSCGPLSKRLYVCTADALKQQWNSLKTEFKGSNLAQKMIEIEKHGAQKNGFQLVKAFFLGLNGKEGIQEINL